MKRNFNVLCASLLLLTTFTLNGIEWDFSSAFTEGRILVLTTKKSNLDIGYLDNSLDNVVDASIQSLKPNYKQGGFEIIGGISIFQFDFYMHSNNAK